MNTRDLIRNEAAAFRLGLPDKAVRVARSIEELRVRCREAFGPARQIGRYLRHREVVVNPLAMREVE